MWIHSRWIKYQQITLLNVKSSIHYLIHSKDLKSMENMLHTEGKAVVGNNIFVSSKGEEYSRLKFTVSIVFLTLVFLFTFLPM